MNLFKRTYQLLRFQWKQSIAYILFFSLLVCNILMILMTQQTENAFDYYYQNRFGKELTLSVQYGNNMDLKSSSFLNADQLLNYADSDYLSSSSITLSSYQLLQLDETYYQPIYLYASNDFNINYSPSLLAGRLPQNSSEIIISQQLAETFNLSLLQQLSFLNGQVFHDFTITGIYEDGSYDFQGTPVYVATFLDRQITSFLSPLNSQALFYLKDYKNKTNFIQETKQKGMEDFLSLETNSAYDLMLFAPFHQSTSNLTNYFFTFLIMIVLLYVSIRFILWRQEKKQYLRFQYAGVPTTQITLSIGIQYLLLSLCSVVIAYICYIAIAQPLFQYNLQQASISELVFFQNQIFSIPLNSFITTALQPQSLIILFIGISLGFIFAFMLSYLCVKRLKKEDYYKEGFYEN